MTRIKFFAAIAAFFGVKAHAQQGSYDDSKRRFDAGAYRRTYPDRFPDRGQTVAAMKAIGGPLPVNGECPYCRTAAPKLDSEKDRKHCRHDGGGNACDELHPLITTKLIRCICCSAAFFQDAY